MKSVFTLFLLLCSLQNNAQKTKPPLIDSLVNAIPSSENDTIKARLYNRIFNELTFINVDEAMRYARIGLVHTQNMNWPKGIAVFHDNIGRVYSDMGNYDSALFYYNASLATHTKANDKFNMANTYNNLAVAAQNNKADYTTAAGFYFKALKLAEEMNDSTILSVSLGNIARIYMLQKNYTKALEFDNKALRIREKKSSADEIASSWENVGKTYYMLTNLPKAKEYFQKALTLYEGTGNMAGLASVWSNLSLVYGNDYRSIVEARIKSKELWDEVNPMHTGAITNTGNLGAVYLDIVRYDTNHVVKYADVIPANKNILLQKAQQYVEVAIQLATQSGDIDTKSYFTGILAEVLELKGDYKNAYYNFKLYTETQDSIYSQENKNKIAAAESQLEIDKKNSEIKIKQLALSNQRKTMWGFTGGLALLTIIGILIYRQSQLRKKTNNTLVKLNEELDNANKVKAKFFAMLSHDFRAPVANLISFLQLQKNEPGLLSAEQLSRNQQKITSSAVTLLENMETMLLWSKSQMENFKPEKNKVSAADLFEKLQKSFAAVEGVKITCPETDNIILKTDENYLFTIVYNLTANAVAAIKNTPGAAIKWDVQADSSSVIFSIADNGPGLPPEITAILNNNSTQLGSKNGLGFHIIKDMAKAIDCIIRFESSNNGTVFTLQLPG